MLEIFGANDFLHVRDFLRLMLRLLFDLTFLTMVVCIYQRLHKRRDFIFTYVLFNIVTFSLCFLLRKVPIELGFALGLFAVFGIIRYRTEAIRARDLTYLFVVIGIAILNAVANKRISVAEVVLINSVIVGLTWLMECAPFWGREEPRAILYDNLELLKPGNDEALRQDLCARTGLNVRHVVIGDVDLLRDVARVTAFCISPEERRHVEDAHVIDTDRCAISADPGASPGQPG